MQRSDEIKKVKHMKGNGKSRARLVIWLALFLSLTGGAQGQGATHVDVLQIEGAVTPIMISYIERGIGIAQDDGAEALVVLLNTPGGQTDLMNRVITAILSSEVPVIVYVYPQGAYAASAGTLITLAGHAAAMAPGTTIGAASPVGGQGEDLGETLEAKIKEDLKAQARGLAARRGEAAVAWAESAIEEARAATAEEALQLGVIDLVARDLQQLLDGLDGLEVEVSGQQVILNTAGAEVREVPMNFPEQFLHIITNPTVAFILLTVGINAILFELSSPGGGAAGVVGAICVVLAFYALGVLPVNYAGLIFIFLAFALFVADVVASTGGVLTVGGVVSLVAGALLLFNSPLYQVSLSAIVSVALVTGLFFAFGVTKVIQARRRPPVTGSEGLVGALAEARTPLEPRGTVFVKGELWQAESLEGPVEKGARVEIVGITGFRLHVRRVPGLPESDE
jgi:membrane-bound serine protease (ClpP class)